MYISQVFTAQQYRSQALHENTKMELTPSNYKDERKKAILSMMEQINLRTRSSTEFLEVVGKKMVEISKADDDGEVECDIWGLCQL